LPAHEIFEHPADGLPGPPRCCIEAVGPRVGRFVHVRLEPGREPLGRKRQRTEDERVVAHVTYLPLRVSSIFLNGPLPQVHVVRDKIRSIRRDASVKGRGHMDPEHYRKLENMYAAAPINQLYQPRIEIAEGTAEIAMAVDARFFHAAGAMH